jgi:hypothetical protein
MPSGDVVSPPYPTRVTRAAGLHKMLLELYGWWADQLPAARGFLNGLPLEVQQRLFPDVSDARELKRIFQPSSVKVETDFDRYHGVSVQSMHMAFEAMQAIRERFDDLLRHFELEWDSADAVYLRLSLLRATQFILSVAFLSAEQFEAREEEAARLKQAAYVQHLRQAVHELQNHLRTISSTSRIKILELIWIINF